MSGFSISEEQRQTYDRDGFLVTPAAFGEAELAPVRAAIADAWSLRKGERARAEEVRWDRLRPELPRLHRVNQSAAAFCRSPVFAAIAAAFIGPDADMMWNQAHVKAADEDGMTAFPWHQDGAYADMEKPNTLSCWVALTACDARNGAMLMAPGSHGSILRHEWDDELKYMACEAPDDTFQLELELGQVVVFGPRTAHASPPNLSGENRFGYSLSFSLPENRLLPSRAPFGDQVPLIRGGRHIDEVMRDYVRGVASTREVGDRVVRWILERLPNQKHAIAAALKAYRDAVRGGDAQHSRDALSSLFAISEDDVSINGDLIRARTDPDAIMREYPHLSRDVTLDERRQLLLRALELDPDHSEAKSALARLG